MVFANLFFLYIFLPVNLILYYATRSYAVRNFVLVAMSFLFYAWGEPGLGSAAARFGIHGVVLQSAGGTVRRNPQGKGPH